MDTFYRLLVAAHGLVGLVALVTFWIAAAAKKGSPLHVRTGKVYMVAMIGIIVTATPMAETPVVLTTSLVVQDAGTTPSTNLDGFSHDDLIGGHVSTRPNVGTVHVLDVRVRVFAWQLNGQPASTVEFAWTCLAEGVITSKV